MSTLEGAATIDRVASSNLAKLQESGAPAEEGFHPATMAAGGGSGSGTCQRNLPAKPRRKNEATPVYTIPGIPPPPFPQSQPNVCSSPPRQGLKEKAKAAVLTPVYQKAGEIEERARKKLNPKIFSILPGNKDKNKW